MPNVTNPRGCIRLQSLRTKSAFLAAAKHDFRIDVGTHINPTPKFPNVYWGTTDPQKLVNDVTLRRKRAPNGRESYGYESLITIPRMVIDSPENQRRFITGVLTLLASDAVPTPARAVAFHFDELQWHAHGIHDAFCEKANRCVYGKWAKKKNFRALQTALAKTVGQPLGVQRGIKGSNVTHSEVREHYREIKASDFVLEVEIGPERIPKKGLTEKHADYAVRVAAVLNEFQAPKLRTLKHRAANQQTAAHRTKELEVSLQGKNGIIESLEKKIRERDGVIQTLRVREESAQVAIERLQKEWGADRADSIRDRSPRLGPRDALAALGYSGAQKILVNAKPDFSALHAVSSFTNCDVWTAAHYLADKFGHDVAFAELRAAARHKPELFKVKSRILAPGVCPEMRGPVVEMLAKRTGLANAELEELEKTGLFYADAKGRAIFPHKDRKGFVRGWSAVDKQGCWGPRIETDEESAILFGPSSSRELIVTGSPLSTLTAAARSPQARVFCVPEQPDVVRNMLTAEVAAHTHVAIHAPQDVATADRLAALPQLALRAAGTATQGKTNLCWEPSGTYFESTDLAREPDDLFPR